MSPLWPLEILPRDGPERAGRPATRIVFALLRKRFTPEEILQHLLTVEHETGKGLAVFDACRKLEIAEQTRAQFLNGKLPYTLKGVQIMMEYWRRYYINIRSHSSLGSQPPTPEAAPACDLKANLIGGTRTSGWSRLRG